MPSVKERGDRLVGHEARKRPDEFFGGGCRSPTMLSGPILLDGQRGMVTALPVQQKPDLILLNPHHDLVEDGADDSFACRGGG